jgi:hypothetical protein
MVPLAQSANKRPARDPGKAEAAFTNIQKETPDAVINILELDLAAFGSVKNIAKRFR